MSRQVLKPSSAQQACEEAGVLLVEASRQVIRKAGGRPFAGATALYQGQKIIVVRADLSGCDKAEVVNKLLQASVVK
jgi:hypothetical protein